jgi:hypothetical protein
LRFPFDGLFEFSGKCHISQEGHIEWLLENEEQKKETWNKVMGISNQANSTSKIVEDNDLTNFKEKRKIKVNCHHIRSSRKWEIYSSPSLLKKK